MSSSDSELESVFAHFLNRESVDIFGARANLSAEKLTATLKQYLNIAVFLAGEYCVIPPGWVDEYAITRSVLERSIELLHTGLVRMPMREEKLDDFHKKRTFQYLPFRRNYPDLFAEENILFLEDNADALIGREAGVGARIRAEWVDQSLSAPPVAEFAATLSLSKRRAVSRIASDIAADGVAIVWPAVEARLAAIAGASPQSFRHLLQKLNFETYLEEYGLRTISGLPLARYDFGITNPDLRYDYRAIRSALQAAQAWVQVCSLDATGLSQLRSTKGYLDFRLAFDRIASTAVSPTQVQRRFAAPARRLNRTLRATSDLDLASDRGTTPAGGLHLTPSNILELSFRLEVAALNADNSEPLHVGAAAAVNTATRRKETAVSGSQPLRRIRIGFFVALEMELRILARRWGLTNTYRSRLWTGDLRGADVTVVSPQTMGRVEAALETFQTFENAAPFDIFVVLGLAGGFKEQNISAGSLIVATSIVDMAARKVADDEGGAVPVFRPREYATDVRLRQYLQSGSFDRTRWLSEVVDAAEWPDGLRPVIHFGSLASSDEVVSSSDWVGRLLKAWPMLLGVEMEAGGVCAAADRLSTRVAVARVVSDYADPAKADDVWRVRGMKTLAHLLEFLDFDVLCGA